MCVRATLFSKRVIVYVSRMGTDELESALKLVPADTTNNPDLPANVRGAGDGTQYFVLQKGILKPTL